MSAKSTAPKAEPHHRVLVLFVKRHFRQRQKARSKGRVAHVKSRQRRRVPHLWRSLPKVGFHNRLHLRILILAAIH